MSLPFTRTTTISATFTAWSAMRSRCLATKSMPLPLRVCAGSSIIRPISSLKRAGWRASTNSSFRITFWARTTSPPANAASAMRTCRWQRSASFGRSCRGLSGGIGSRSIACRAMFTARSPIRSRSTTTFTAVVMNRMSIRECRRTRSRRQVSSTWSSSWSTSASASMSSRASAGLRSSNARIAAATPASTFAASVSNCSRKSLSSASREGAATRDCRAEALRSWLPARSKGRLSLHRHRPERLLHFLHHPLGQRSVVQGWSGLLPVVHRPPEELEQRVAFHGVLLVLVDEQVGEGRDGPCVLAVGVGDRDAIVVRHLRLGGGCGDGFQRGLDEGTRLVLQLRDRELVLVRVRQLDVADAAFRLLDDAGDAFVPLAAQPGGPIHALSRARARLPLGRHLGQVVGEDRGGARAVAAVGYDDLQVRKLRALVLRRDRRIVPLGDLAQEDAGHGLRRELQVLHARRVVDDDHRAHHRRDVLDAGRLQQLLAAHGSVGSAEVHRLLGDLLDAAARADRLVVDLHARVRLVVLAEPLRIDRERERGTRAVDQGGVRRGRSARDREQRKQDPLHRRSLWNAHSIGWGMYQSQMAAR